LFHVFHKYGKLAQISIKQAYGFVQFLDANACYQALQAEQGGVVRGRKIRTCLSFYPSLFSFGDRVNSLSPVKLFAF
jgi:hypothetical protein